MTLTCVIIDDEPSAIEVLNDFASKIPNVSVLKSFRDPLQALTFLKENKVDFIFLDINMPQLSGMELVKVLSNPPLVIFTTAYTEYAVESYEENAVDYLLKPIPFERVLVAINKVQDRLQRKNSDTENFKKLTDASQETIYLKSGTKTHRIILDEVLYLEKDGHYITFHTFGKKIVARLSINDVFELIPKTNFMQVHKSFIVSIAKVEIIERHQIKIGTSYIPIGKTFSKMVHEFFKSGF